MYDLLLEKPELKTMSPEWKAEEARQAALLKQNPYSMKHEWGKN